jgi:uncharacterized protein (UPF0216 family)
MMLNESALKKWFKFEMGKINSGIVIKKKSLCDLVNSPSPKTKTRDGSTYYFDSKVLKHVSLKIPENMQSIKLPISIYATFNIRGSVYIAESSPLKLLKRLGEISEKAELSDGKYWISKMIALDIMKRYPSIIQFVRY